MFTKEFWKHHNNDANIAHDIVQHTSLDKDINQLGASICDDIAKINVLNEELSIEIKKDLKALKNKTFGSASDTDKINKIFICNALNTVKTLLEEFNSHDSEKQKTQIISALTQYMVFDVCPAGRVEKLHSLVNTLKNLKQCENTEALMQSSKQMFIESIVQDFFRDAVPTSEEIHYVQGTLAILSNEYGLEACGNLKYERYLRDSDQIYNLRRFLMSQEFFESFVNYIVEQNIPLSPIADGLITGLSRDDPRYALQQLCNARTQDAMSKLGAEAVYKNSNYDAYNRNIDHISKLYYIRLMNNKKMLDNSEMKVLSMDSVMNLITLLGSDTVDKEDNIVSNSAVTILGEFPTIDNILRSTKLVTNGIQKDLVLNQLSLVKTEMNNLQINDTLKSETLFLIESSINDLSQLTEKDYINNQKLASFSNEQIRVISQINSKKFLEIFNGSSCKENFLRKMKATFGHIIRVNTQSEFNDKVNSLFDAFEKIRTSNGMNGYRLQLSDLQENESNKIKDVCWFIVKCLTFIYVYEILTGNDIVQSESDIKNEISGFVKFLKNSDNNLSATIVNFA